MDDILDYESEEKKPSNNHLYIAYLLVNIVLSLLFIGIDVVNFDPLLIFARDWRIFGTLATSFALIYHISYVEAVWKNVFITLIIGFVVLEFSFIAGNVVRDGFDIDDSSTTLLFIRHFLFNLCFALFVKYHSS